MSKAIHAHRDELLDLAIRNGGNTRGDAKFDIDGAWGTLAYYAELGKELGDSRFLVDGDGIQLGRAPRFFGQHVRLPRSAWPCTSTPSTSPPGASARRPRAPSSRACRCSPSRPPARRSSRTGSSSSGGRKRILAARGALSSSREHPGDLLTHLGPQDVLAFTGSGDTGAHLRGSRTWRASPCASTSRPTA
jgi:3,4-dehydroadipyl-CoA semialdehyde dehydrogenase